jgi:hypothetical protein
LRGAPGGARGGGGAGVSHAGEDDSGVGV